MGYNQRQILLKLTKDALNTHSNLGILLVDIESPLSFYFRRDQQMHGILQDFFLKKL